jgi:signal transduction histidine kinase
MLDEMETLIHSLAGVGNNIAHDLRTPLTRARLTLERGRTSAKTLEQLQMVADKTMDGMDQSLSIITAILRLAEIENSQRSAGFGKVALADLVREVGDMYEPIAEDKGIAVVIHSPHELSAYGDRDLLIEAVANLVDNAVKFTPAGGQVEIGLFRGNGENIVRVKDTGSGTSEHERDAVLRRFYRSDNIRHKSGLGLGLNLVTAIVKLHGFRFTLVPGPGCVVEIACPYAPTSTEPAKINSLVTEVPAFPGLMLATRPEILDSEKRAMRRSPSRTSAMRPTSVDRRSMPTTRARMI